MEKDKQTAGLQGTIEGLQRTLPFQKINGQEIDGMVKGWRGKLEAQTHMLVQLHSETNGVTRSA